MRVAYVLKPSGRPIAARFVRTCKNTRRRRVSSKFCRLAAYRSEADGSAGDGLDLRALDAEIVQFAGGHAIEFVDGLTVLAPIAEGTCHVHDDALSGGSLFGTGPWRRVFGWPSYRTMLHCRTARSWHVTHAADAWVWSSSVRDAGRMGVAKAFRTFAGLALRRRPAAAPPFDDGTR